MSSAVGFGAFFRKRRKALGLTLREFCRRNGFDAGNVSRLERGLIPPPRAGEILDSYAKALRIADGTTERETFYDLASAATGQLPKESLASQSTVQNLPTLLRNLRGQRHLNWVTETDLETWAGTLAARSRLPQLVRRLIYASADPLLRIDIPDGEGVQRSGWDGIVETATGSAFVPSGTSGWEMGVDQDPRQKAEQDYKTRTANTSGLEKSQTTFVFVTPRKWAQKRKWSQEKNAQRVWKEVRAYDSSDLEQWLETAPAVDGWFARIIGKRPAHLTDLDEHWTNLATLTDPNLSPEVFLVSRQKEVESFQEWIKAPPSALVIEARSPAEVMDFLAAYLAKPPSAAQEGITARALVIDDKETWRSVSTSGKRLLLMAHPSFGVEPELVAEAVRAGHHVALPSNRLSSERFQKLILPRADQYDLQKALVACGFSQEKADKAAKESGGSMTVLKRLLARIPGTIEPEWSKTAHAVDLVPFILAGSWDDESESDRQTLEALAGRPYDQIAMVADQTLALPDSPLLRVLSRWSLVSREDSWFLLSRSIGKQHVERLAKVAIPVLTADSPALELPPDKRWQAAWHQKTPIYSEALRTGISETLILLAARPQRISVPAHPEQRVQWLVRKVFDGADWKRWASLSRQLPLLAEAAPEAFLDTIESDLRSPSPAIFGLFEEGEDAFVSSHPHTGLLWALEILAWSTQYLGRVASVLAELAERAPKTKILNSPINTLREIFLPWYPHTSASVESRVKVLDRLLERFPDTAWTLLIQLLPNIHDTSTPTSRPSWRADWAIERSKGITNAEYWEQVIACAGRLISHAGSSVNRWLQLIKHFDHFPEPVHKEALERLASLRAEELSTDARRQITDTLRELVRKHRQFQEASWALPSETVDRLEQLRTVLEPQDTVTRNAWLFGHHWDLVEEMAGDALHEKEVQLLGTRIAAMKEVFSIQGMAGILEMASVAKAPNEVGFAVGKGEIGVPEQDIIPKLLLSDNESYRRFASGYVYGRWALSRRSWVEGLQFSQWSAPEAGEFLLLLDFDEFVWSLAARLGSDVEEYYWRRKTGFCRDGTQKDVEFAVSMLCKYHRPFEACNVLVMALFHEKCDIDPTLVLQVLRAGLTEDGANEIRADQNRIGFNVQRLITWLQGIVERNDSAVEEDQIAAIEWGYQRVLEHTRASPVILHRMLQRSPEFFTEVISAVYRSKDETPVPDYQPTDLDKAKAETGYRLLSSWRALPGQAKDGSVDGDILMSWIKRSRDLCKDAGRLDTCDMQIGTLFAYAPEEPDGGGWPCVAVRDAIEEIDSQRVTRGFEIGIFNKRGAYNKSMTEGGAQEWNLAKKHRDWADICAIDWPKTAASLRNVAVGYEDHARREDAEAQVDD